jgi:hypothetical protein
MHKRKKAPEKIELGFAVFLHLDPALRTPQHAHKAAQQQFRERVEHFRLLPRLRYFLEKLKPAEPMTNQPSRTSPHGRFSIRSFGPDGNPYSDRFKRLPWPPLARHSELAKKMIYSGSKRSRSMPP